VEPHEDRDAIDRLPPQGGMDALFGVHASYSRIITNELVLVLLGDDWRSDQTITSSVRAKVAWVVGQAFQPDAVVRLESLTYNPCQNRKLFLAQSLAFQLHFPNPEIAAPAGSSGLFGQGVLLQ
jgi:hypothetical protein